MPRHYSYLFMGIALLFVVVVPHVAWAQQATAAQIEDAGYMPGLWPSVISNINTTLNTVLSNRTYSLWTKGIFTGLMLCGFIWQMFRWQQGAITTGDGISYLIQIFLFAAFFVSYNTWTYWLYEAGYELGTMIQVAALNTDALLGPSVYLGKVFQAYVVDNSGSIFTLGITRFALGLVFTGIQVATSLAAYVSLMWPTLIYMLAKLIGPICFIGLAFERTAFLFDGWFKLLLFASAYALISRVVLVITAMLAAGLTGVAFSTTATPQLIVIPATSFTAYATVLCMLVASLLFILGAGGFTAFIIGSSDIGLGKAVQGAARLATKIAGGGK